MVVSLTYVTVMEQKMSQKTKSSVGSFFTAESGVEWALNQIATGSGDTINSKFGTQATNATNEGKMTCPFSSDCNIYLLDSSGNVIPKYQFGNPNSADLVKAVRSVGSQNQETQRAIEAAVAQAADCSPVPTEITNVNGGASGTTKTIAEAATACRAMGNCWHLPSIEELVTFVDPAKGDEELFSASVFGGSDTYVTIRLSDGYLQSVHSNPGSGLKKRYRCVR
jgi:hypothetical protein